MRTKSPSKQSKVDLTISIVSFNTKALLKRCLESVFKHTRGIKFEVIVVDNHSTDGSVAMVQKDFPSVKLIVNANNRFYTGANNQALGVACGKYFLILNSDVYLKDDAFTKMVNYLKKNPRVGAIEATQKDEKGKVLKTASRHNSLLLDLIELTWFGRLVKPWFKEKLNHFRMTKKDRTKTFAAEVISDAMMMMATALLRKLGGYDERFKLYYTENDLCKGVQKRKLKTVHFGGATIWHRVSASTDKAGWRTISAIYTDDAYVYYAKHHSPVAAVTLWLAMQLNNALVTLKQNWQIASILMLSILLRFYRLADWMTFIGDQGRDYLAARDWLLTGQLPLLGIPSSVPWLHQGPFFVWMTGIAFRLGGFNPIVPAIMTATLGVLTVLTAYAVTKKWFNQNAALAAALITAASPLMVIHSRLAYHISPIPIAAWWFVYELFKLTKKQTNWFWPTLAWGILLQFELTVLPLGLLILLSAWWGKVKWGNRQLIPTTMALLLPFLPKVIYDFQNSFIQTFGLIAWAGYRFLSFFLPGQGHTPSFAGLNQVNNTILNYWQKWAIYDQPFAAGILLAGLLLLAVLKKRRLILAYLVINLAAFYLHGGPSEAYFPALFPVWTLLLALPFYYFSKKWLWLPLLALVFYNGQYLFKNQFVPYGPNLTERMRVVYLISHLLPDGQSAQLETHVSLPDFSAYLDNYRYLLWWQRVPVTSGQDGKTFIIYDGREEDFRAPAGTTVYHLDRQKVMVYD